MAKSTIKQKLAQKKTKKFSPQPKLQRGSSSSASGVKLKRRGCCGKV